MKYTESMPSPNLDFSKNLVKGPPIPERKTYSKSSIKTTLHECKDSNTAVEQNGEPS
jgi:hypothetical protein